MACYWNIFEVQLNQQMIEKIKGCGQGISMIHKKRKDFKVKSFNAHTVQLDEPAG